MDWLKYGYLPSHEVRDLHIDSASLYCENVYKYLVCSCSDIARESNTVNDGKKLQQNNYKVTDNSSDDALNSDQTAHDNACSAFCESECNTRTSQISGDAHCSIPTAAKYGHNNTGCNSLNTDGGSNQQHSDVKSCNIEKVTDIAKEKNTTKICMRRHVTTEWEPIHRMGLVKGKLDSFKTSHTTYNDIMMYEKVKKAEEIFPFSQEDQREQEYINAPFSLIKTYWREKENFELGSFKEHLKSSLIGDMDCSNEFRDESEESHNAREHISAAEELECVWNEYDEKKSGATYCQFSNRGERIGVASCAGDILICDVESGKIISQYKGVHLAAALQLCWSSNDNYLYTVGSDCAVNVLDVRNSKVEEKIYNYAVTNGTNTETNNRLKFQHSMSKNYKNIGIRFPNTHAIGSMSITCPVYDKGAAVFCTGGYDQSLKIWDTRSTSTPLCEVQAHTDTITNCEFNNDGDCLLSSSMDGTVRFFSTQHSIKLLKSIIAIQGEGCGDASLSASEKFCLVTNALGMKARIWNAAAAAYPENNSQEKGTTSDRIEENVSIFARMKAECPDIQIYTDKCLKKQRFNINGNNLHTYTSCDFDTMEHNDNSAVARDSAGRCAVNGADVNADAICNLHDNDKTRNVLEEFCGSNRETFVPIKSCDLRSQESVCLTAYNNINQAICESNFHAFNYFNYGKNNAFHCVNEAKLNTVYRSLCRKYIHCRMDKMNSAVDINKKCGYMYSCFWRDRACVPCFDGTVGIYHAMTGMRECVLPPLHSQYSYYSCVSSYPHSDMGIVATTSMPGPGSALVLWQFKSDEYFYSDQ